MMNVTAAVHAVDLDNVKRDAARYRKLQGWMSSNVPEGWQEVERMAALCAWQSQEDMDSYLDSLGECQLGLMSPPIIAKG